MASLAVYSVLTAIGSYNLSLRSSYIESENLIFVHDRHFSARRENSFLSLVGNQGKEITDEYLSELKARHKSRIEISRYLELLY